jgi:hypothetical protein
MAAVSICDIRHREMRPEVQAAPCTVSTKNNLQMHYFLSDLELSCIFVQNNLDFHGIYEESHT